MEKSIVPTKQAVKRAVFTGSLLLAAIGIISLLSLQFYQQKNNQVFHSLLEENLQTYHLDQVSRAKGIINQISRLVEALAFDYQSITSPVREALAGLDAVERIEFIPLRELEQKLETEGAFEDAAQALQNLREGDILVSSVFGYDGMEDKSVFGIIAAVYREGDLAGALRCLVSSKCLVSAPDERARSHPDSYLVLKDGIMLQSGSEYLSGRRNIIEELARHGIGSKDIQRIKSYLAFGGCHGCQLQSKEYGRIYVGVSDLGYNGWRLITFETMDEVGEYSASVNKNTVFLAGELLALVLLFIFGITWVYISQRKKIMQGQVRYDVLAKFSDTILFEYDCEGHVLMFTPNIREQFPVMERRIVMPLKENLDSGLLHPEDVPRIREFLRNVDDLEADAQSLEMRFLSGDGTYHWMDCQCMLLRGKNGKPQTLFGKLSDVHEQKEKEQELLLKSTTDPLTGILNRAGTENRIRRYLKPDANGFLFMIDLDNFKAINDNMGHAAGDRLLRQFAQLLKKEFREKDVIGRLGGDEFVVYMAGARDRIAAENKAERLLALCVELGDIYTVSASVGIAAYPRDGRDYAVLYEEADQAMYQAKKNGKNSYCFAEELIKQ